MKHFRPAEHNGSVSPSAAAEELQGSDEVLMERLRDGDVRAFDALFERHADSIHRFLSRRVGDPARAEDLTQETFLSVIRARGRYLPGRSFRQWLYAIASNAARHDLRAHRREGARLQKLAEAPPAGAGGDGAGVDERAVRQALAQLPDAQREVIVLHAYEGMTFAEVAEMLGTSGVAVRLRAHRGYRRLRKLLGHLEEER
jgi:RNA polymerase sigma-70 factor (ECF subfamily)